MSSTCLYCHDVCTGFCTSDSHRLTGERPWRPSPPPQPALDRLARDADESERRGVEWRERALRAEARERALRLEVAALKEAQGELLWRVEFWGLEVDRLRGAIFDYVLWEPGRKGHAAAHERLRMAARI